MEIRLYEEWCDENINTDCCVCGDSTQAFVIDFKNYKTTICDDCIQTLIDKLEDCKNMKVCRKCEYRVLKGFCFICSCETSKNFNECKSFNDVGCDRFKRR